MSVADAMASNGMKDAGYEYINLDGTTVANSYLTNLVVSSRDTIQIVGQITEMTMALLYQTKIDFLSKTDYQPYYLLYVLYVVVD